MRRRTKWGLQRVIIAAACALGLLLSAGCGGEAPSPEDQVRARIAAAEEAAEAQEIKLLREMISDAYSDPYGRTKRDLEQMLAYYFFRNQAVHLLTRVSSVEIDETGVAQVLAYVAMAGVPIPAPDLLPSLRADLYRFEVQMRVEEEEWRVQHADWRPAALADFQ